MYGMGWNTEMLLSGPSSISAMVVHESKGSRVVVPLPCKSEVLFPPYTIHDTPKLDCAKSYLVPAVALTVSSRVLRAILVCSLEPPEYEACLHRRSLGHFELRSLSGG